MPLPIKIAWTDRLAFEIALMLEGSGEPLNAILQAHQISPQQMELIAKDTMFDAKVKSYREEIVTKGLTFRLKARAQAEDLLLTSYQLIHHPDVSPAVKADLIKSTVKWAGLEPKDGAGNEQGGGGVKITINLGGEQVPMRVIEGDASE